MLDKLISLSAEAIDTDGGEGAVEIELWTTAPSAQARLRLWNAGGRDPKQPPLAADSPNRWRLGRAAELFGGTLTWSVRMAGDPGSHYELRLQVYQGATPLPEGSFFYAGPLESLEERSGSFHFRRLPKPSGQPDLPIRPIP